MTQLTYLEGALKNIIDCLPQDMPRRTVSSCIVLSSRSSSSPTSGHIWSSALSCMPTSKWPCIQILPERIEKDFMAWGTLTSWSDSKSLGIIWSLIFPLSIEMLRIQPSVICQFHILQTVTAALVLPGKFTPSFIIGLGGGNMEENFVIVCLSDHVSRPIINTLQDYGFLVDGHAVMNIEHLSCSCSAGY